MQETVRKIFTHGKGVLALDWSPGTIKKQFEKVGLESTPELNRIYRQMLLTSPNINLFVSGVILNDETVNQKMDSGTSFVDYLSELGIVPGVRADVGGDYFSGSEQKMTGGLDGIEERFKLYSEMGFRFTKWRAAFQISDIYPTEAFIKESIDRLVEFAKISHKYRMVPFVEPDVEIKGTHTTTRCADISSKVLKKLFNELKKAKLDIKNIILKTNMVLPGIDSGVMATPLEVAGATLRVFRESLPKDLPGVVFLSGGQSYDDAVMFLDKIEDLSKDDNWDLSFSYARALQKDALAEWKGKKENVEDAQKILISRLEKVARAREGKL
jgi:fructose-bisphosphate aldolase, class I